MNFLHDILEHKRTEVETQRKRAPESALRSSPLFQRPVVSLKKAITGKPMAVIAEIKKASPSRGLLHPDMDPIAVAESYVRGGASALSILTDQRYFQGDLSIITAVRARTTLPLLRKDFIIDEYQLTEARAAGADAVLLIVAALDETRLSQLLESAHALGLETLAEIHNAHELEVLHGLNTDVIGINNRDLGTFEVDLGVTERLAPLLPHDVPIVSESGISSPAHLRQLWGAGIHAVLIGEALMRATEPGEALSTLLSGIE
jgi:indole-3-glycerol phosphate synthase